MHTDYQSCVWKQIEPHKLAWRITMQEKRLCSSFRHDSLKSRNGSIAGEFNISRNSVSVLFGAKYVSTIILTTLSAFFDGLETRQNAHSGDQGIYFHKIRYFSLVVRKRICVQL
jgi:hypothetical protein